MAQQLSEKMTAFLSARLDYFNTLKSHTEQQKLLLALGKNYLNGSELLAADFRILKTLLAAEQATEKAAEAARAARKIITEENEKHRKQRTHNLINAGGLLGLAGLLDKKTGALLASKEQILGALIELANRTPTEQERIHWAEVGASALAKAKAEKSKTSEQQ